MPRGSATSPPSIDGPTGRTLTYRQLVDGARRAAAGLARRGFGKGDVLAIYCPNLPEYAIVFLGVAMAGGVNTTVNPLYTADELANQLRDSGARFLVTVPPFLEKAKEGGGQERRSRRSSSWARPTAPGPSPISCRRAISRPRSRSTRRDDLVALPYSSGTTGLPKGVMLTHRNLVANLCQAEGMRNFECFGEQDVTMAVLPFFHIYGMVVIMMLGLAGGGTILVMPRFDMMEFLALVQKYRVTVLPLVPPIVLGLVKHPAVAQFDLSSVRLTFSGAAPLGEEIARALSAKLGCPVVQGYGMTEASPVTHLSPTHDEPFKPGSAGKIVPNTEVKIVEVGSGGAPSCRSARRASCGSAGRRS